jgi:hypothetical protein
VTVEMFHFHSINIRRRVQHRTNRWIGGRTGDRTNNRHRHSVIDLMLLLPLLNRTNSPGRIDPTQQKHTTPYRVFGSRPGNSIECRSVCNSNSKVTKQHINFDEKRLAQPRFFFFFFTTMTTNNNFHHHQSYIQLSMSTSSGFCQRRKIPNNKSILADGTTHQPSQIRGLREIEMFIKRQKPTRS